MKRVLCALVGWLLAVPAWAQSPYVAGAIGAEIVRSTSVKSPGSTFDNGNGESWSGAIRVGTLVAPRFGVELEFLRPGVIESDGNGSVFIAAGIPRTVVGSPASTVSTLAFVRQVVGERVDLGDLGFSRIVHEIEFGILT